MEIIGDIIVLIVASAFAFLGAAVVVNYLIIKPIDAIIKWLSKSNA